MRQLDELKGFYPSLDLEWTQRVFETTRRVDGIPWSSGCDMDLTSWIATRQVEPVFRYLLISEGLDEFMSCTRRVESTWAVDLGVDFR